MGSAFAILVVLGCTFVALRLAQRALLIVPSERLFVVERAGRFLAVLPPGLHVLIPFLDSVVRKFRTDGEVLDAPEQHCVAADGKVVRLTCRLRYEVKDPVLAVYAAPDLSFGLLQMLQRELAEIVGKVPAELIRDHSGTLEKPLMAALQGKVGAWGIGVSEVEFESSEF